ncbi:hypothetical protein FGO68_gene9522 [Halteria grandinella]|uniref:Uncharacterized protein n=1 Tax=Halteria grandinella TaxID=5974 RepID=A0A8J8NAL7_HALGN|nr:hypothetical protein FGO68_gene9522 [Halteria grandinella]
MKSKILITLSKVTIQRGQQLTRILHLPMYLWVPLPSHTCGICKICQQPSAMTRETSLALLIREANQNQGCAMTIYIHQFPIMISKSLLPRPMNQCYRQMRAIKRRKKWHHLLILR